MKKVVELKCSYTKYGFCRRDDFNGPDYVVYKNSKEGIEVNYLCNPYVCVTVVEIEVGE